MAEVIKTTAYKGNQGGAEMIGTQVASNELVGCPLACGGSFLLPQRPLPVGDSVGEIFQSLGLFNALAPPGINCRPPPC